MHNHAGSLHLFACHPTDFGLVGRHKSWSGVTFAIALNAAERILLGNRRGAFFAKTALCDRKLHMPNRLAKTSSPYLLQHQNNPVDWYPWCQEALEKARAQDRPIFLSIGYSACHWCHVMEHESFENEQIAAILNQSFVSIKVDREERPDLDQIYMHTVQMLTGSGGWPMSVFLTPDCKPFFGGTYWPPENRWGRPGFAHVLSAVIDAWKSKRSQIEEQSEQITSQLVQACRGPESVESDLDQTWIEKADRWLKRHFDATFGGFGGAPKFPHTMDLGLMLDLHCSHPQAERANVVRTSLDKMAAGGIYDHLGGGFARYSVDERWLVPHFEKMLYDNALLASLYADAYRTFGDASYLHVVRETLGYLTRDMTDTRGGIYSAEDADSEGEEGKFYVWSASEISNVLGVDRAAPFCEAYDITEVGNFEGQNVLNLPKSLEQFARLRNLDLPALQLQFAADRVRLFEHRKLRIRPGLDDKVLASWNALAIIAYAKGYRASGDVGMLSSAQAIAEFFYHNMRRSNGRLWHSWRGGQTNHDAYLDDYSYLIEALVELYQADWQTKWIAWALELAACLVEHFQDTPGGFMFTADDAEQLIARNKDVADHSVPSGNAMAASGFLGLAMLTNRNDLYQIAENALRSAAILMQDSPQAAGQSLRVLNRLLNKPTTLILVGEHPNDEWTRAIELCHRSYWPHALVAARLESERSPDAQSDPLNQLFHMRLPIQNQVTLYVCRDQTCEPPCVGLNTIQQRLQSL